MKPFYTGPFNALVRVKAALFEDRDDTLVFDQKNVCPTHTPAHTLHLLHNVALPSHQTLCTIQHHHASLHHIHLHRH